MKRKIDKSKLESCKLVWKKRIAAEKGISETVSYTHLTLPTILLV